VKDERFNDSWHRSFVNQDRAQGLSDVLVATFHPDGDEQTELFHEKQLYMYAVLESKVLTNDAGKAIIRRYEEDANAQKVYAELVEHHLRSTKAMIDSSSILSYITSVCMGNGEFQGTAENFVLHWQQQVRLYQRQVPSSDHFSDGQLCTILENAVSPLEELRQVKVHGDLHKTKTGEALSYDEYSSLLLSADAQYDSQNTRTKRGNGFNHRNVYAHDVTHDQDEEIPSEASEEAYDIDYPVLYIQAHAHDHCFKSTMQKQQNQHTLMPRDRWFALKPEAQKIWDQLDDKEKAIILGTGTSTGHVKAPTRNMNLNKTLVFDFLQAHLHEVDSTSVEETDPISDIADGPTTDMLLINEAKTGVTDDRLPPGDIRRVMSKKTRRTVAMADIQYIVSVNQQKIATKQSLVDRGANGGVAGSDVRIIFKTKRTVDIRRIDNHQVTDIDIGTVGGVVESQKGPVIAIMHQYALLNKGHSIHSPCQFESYKVTVDDKSVRISGTQRIQTPDGYTIFLAIKDGLSRLAIRPFTDQEYDSLPQVFLTHEANWDPSILDHEYKSVEEWFDATQRVDTDPAANRFDDIGNYRRRVVVQNSDHHYYHQSYNLDVNNDPDFVMEPNFEETSVTPPDIVTETHDPAEQVHDHSDKPYEILRPQFGWLSTDVIKKTYEQTTQYARIPSSTILKCTFRSPNPALNVHRRNEPVACDVVYADVPAISDGSQAVVLFTGTETHVTDIYGIKNDKEFVNTLEDNIWQRGAPTKLISDHAQVEISKKVLDILCTLCISDWQSEPYQPQQQNHAE
jgi:hypothetical protein